MSAPARHDDLPICVGRGCTQTVFILRKTGKPQKFCLSHWRKLTPTQKRAWEDGLCEDVLEWLEAKDSLIQQAYRYELHPTREQRRWLNMHCRQHRVCYNYAFGVLDAWWNDNKGKERKDRTAQPGDLYTTFNRWLATQPGMGWLADCVANGRNYAFADAQTAFGNFLRRLGQRAAGADVDPGYPRPKKRRDSNRFALQPPTGAAGERWMHTHVGAFEGADGRYYPEIRLPKSPSWRDAPGWIRLKERPDLRGRILKLAFECRPGKRPGHERWWVMCMVEREAKSPVDKRLPGSVVGLDLGVNAVLTLSRPYEGADPPAFLGEDRQSIVPPRPLEAALRRKRRLGHRASRCSGTYYRTKMRELAAREPEGPIPIKSWKSRSKDGPFGAVLKLAVKLKHVRVADDTVQITPYGLRILSSCVPYTYRVGEEERIGIPPSKAWERAQRAIAALDLQIRDQRRDHLNKVSSWIVATYQTIVTEGFNVRDLVAEDVGYRQRRREIMDLGWGDLRVRLNYKTGWYGGTFIQLPADEPTDRTCSRCGTVGEKLHALATTFRCDACGFRCKRQVNTALYCEGFGRSTPPESTGEGPPGSDAPGDRQRRSKRRSAERTGNGKPHRGSPVSPSLPGVRPAGEPPAGGAPFLGGPGTDDGADAHV